ncbi:hypothetical protein [Cytobacillus dafuensis]|uniref:Uncharacterized protein n=1 Tax=Cytobacillus dafuensis TaxID=1742359 RepID=A0A5B8YZW6_CYTDA|nr:hypothetical protein [Cytobacillus dafuensis]QED46254.1 hypothetical protein FSZ17_02560 [Cytobacillus dafuensis]
MTILMTLLPVTAILIILVIVLSLNSKRKFVTVKMTHWLLIIYVGVLLLSFPFASLLTNDSMTSREKVEDLDEVQDWTRFYTALEAGDIEQLESGQVINEKIYDYSNQSLKVEITGLVKPVYVERKDLDDGIIEALVYTNGFYVSGYDFSDKLVPINFRLENDTLSVLYPDQQTINLSIVRNEFTINQFTGQQAFNDVSGIGNMEVYLKVPKSLQLNGTNVDFQFVKE